LAIHFVDPTSSGGGCPEGRSCHSAFTSEEWSRMNPVEYKPARRTWVREVLVGAASGVMSGLVLEVLTAAARLLG
jgi:hypothetical protein